MCVCVVASHTFCTCAVASLRAFACVSLFLTTDQSQDNASGQSSKSSEPFGQILIALNSILPLECEVKHM